MSDQTRISSLETDTVNGIAQCYLKRSDIDVPFPQGTVKIKLLKPLLLPAVPDVF